MVQQVLNHNEFHFGTSLCNWNYHHINWEMLNCYQHPWCLDASRDTLNDFIRTI